MELSFTWGSAYARNQENRTGSITAGKLADLTIFECSDLDSFALQHGLTQVFDKPTHILPNFACFKKI